MDWIGLLSIINNIVDREGVKAADNHRQTILTWLDSYESNRTDYEGYLSFNTSGYTKNLVTDYGGSNCNIIIMCWTPNQCSAFHSHEGSKCFVKILSGKLLEQQVPCPEGGSVISANKCSKRLLTTNSACYIDDSIGMHKMVNPSSEESAISLHIYMPAYRKCRIYERANDEFSLERSFSNDVIFNNKN